MVDTLACSLRSLRPSVSTEGLRPSVLPTTWLRQVHWASPKWSFAPFKLRLKRGFSPEPSPTPAKLEEDGVLLDPVASFGGRGFSPKPRRASPRSYAPILATLGRSPPGPLRGRGWGNASHCTRSYAPCLHSLRSLRWGWGLRPSTPCPFLRRFAPQSWPWGFGAKPRIGLRPRPASWQSS